MLNRNSEFKFFHNAGSTVYLCEKNSPLFFIIGTILTSHFVFFFETQKPPRNGLLSLFPVGVTLNKENPRYKTSLWIAGRSRGNTSVWLYPRRLSRYTEVEGKTMVIVSKRLQPNYVNTVQARWSNNAITRNNVRLFIVWTPWPSPIPLHFVCTPQSHTQVPHMYQKFASRFFSSWRLPLFTL